MANYKVVDADQLDTALGTIADAIRDFTGNTGAISFPIGFADSAAELVEVGKQVATEVCQSKHYVTTMHGTDECNMTFQLPFKPDLICVSFYDPFSQAENNTWCGIIRDFRSFSRFGGHIYRHGTDQGIAVISTKNETIDNYISTNGDGVIFTAPSSMTSFLWRKECVYRVFAINYSDGKTDAELLSEYVLGLPDSGGSVVLSQKRFDEAGMTDTEWAELIAQKPNWTFVFE